jgi:hypothetical protein
VAHSRGAQWGEDDAAHILTNLEQPARELALALGRTSYAVVARRGQLRRERSRVMRAAVTA